MGGLLWSLICVKIQGLVFSSWFTDSAVGQVTLVLYLLNLVIRISCMQEFRQLLEFYGA